jgi:hypothetical protein
VRNLSVPPAVKSRDGVNRYTIGYAVFGEDNMKDFRQATPPHFSFAFAPHFSFAFAPRFSFAFALHFSLAFACHPWLQAPRRCRLAARVLCVAVKGRAAGILVRDEPGCVRL